MNKKETEQRFKERFKDYFKGKKEYLDEIRDRWTNQEVVYIFEYGLRLGKQRENTKQTRILWKERLKIR